MYQSRRRAVRNGRRRTRRAVLSRSCRDRQTRSLFEKCHYLRPRDGRERSEKRVDAVAGLEEFDEGLDGNSRTRKDGGTAHYVARGGYQDVAHGKYVTPPKAQRQIGAQRSA